MSSWWPAQFFATHRNRQKTSIHHHLAFYDSIECPRMRKRLRDGMYVITDQPIISKRVTFLSRAKFFWLKWCPQFHIVFVLVVTKRPSAYQCKSVFKSVQVFQEFFKIKLTSLWKSWVWERAKHWHVSIEQADCSIIGTRISSLLWFLSWNWKYTYIFDSYYTNYYTSGTFPDK